jgi:hypothetical protein
LPFWPELFSGVCAPGCGSSCGRNIGNHPPVTTRLASGMSNENPLQKSIAQLEGDIFTCVSSRVMVGPGPFGRRLTDVTWIAGVPRYAPFPNGLAPAASPAPHPRALLQSHLKLRTRPAGYLCAGGRGAGFCSQGWLPGARVRGSAHPGPLQRGFDTTASDNEK